MCKLGDKDYWQVGDDVYSIAKGRYKVDRIDEDGAYPLLVENTSYLDERYTLEGFCTKEDSHQTLFHLGAITFDDQGRPIAINYDYVPERESKAVITKLPHEFVKGEEVLVKDSYSQKWIKSNFGRFDNTIYPYTMEDGNPFNFCVPFKENEHWEGKVTNCRYGKVPYGYKFPKDIPKVKVTKLPHEFERGEEVLVPFNGVWVLRKFSHYADTPLRSYVMTNQYGYSMCIPLEGNEHLKDEKVTCDSGSIPEDYIFPEVKPKEEPFRNVRIGDTLFRLFRGRYIKGRVALIDDRSKTFILVTDEPTGNREDAEILEGSWYYNFAGEVCGFQYEGQVLFWENPNKQEHEFKPFDKVLVRHSKIATWEIDFFSSYGKNDGFRLRCLSGYYEYCLPFEGNERLLGTNDAPNE